MDPLITSLFPVNQIGADGFNWWIGQIESNKNDDPKNSGRYRVRIVGQHLKSCDATPTEELPWANVMMPVTTPWSDGGVTGASVNLNQGNWVIGFYLDNDKQKPIIMGSVGHTAGATLLKNVEEDPSPGETCKSFTTFLSPDRDPYSHEPLPEEKKTNGNQNTQQNNDKTTVGQAGLPANAVPEKHAANFYGLFANNSVNNPNGAKICVEIADPKCGSESDLKGGLTNILGDMLAATQQSGGQLGDFYVSEITGELNRYVDIGRYHVNRAVRLVKSFIARIKGELVKLIRDGIDYLIDKALYADIPDVDELGNANTGPINPDLGIKPFTPITKKESRLKKVQEFLDKLLEELGCSIEDITDKISTWLTDLLMGYLMDAFNAAACLIDTLINGIINEIVGYLEELISLVMGPLQEILSAGASPLNLIGSAVNTVLGMLGISCDGAAEKCQKVKKECTECDTEETEDWLDKLINEIENGPTDAGSVCSDAKQYIKPKSTKVVAIGGIFDAPKNPSTNLPSIPGSTIGPSNNTLYSTVNTISYTCSDITVVEGNKAVFEIVRSGNISYSSSISYNISNFTAKYGEDYIGTTSGVIGFTAGQKKKKIQVLTLKDNKNEDVEEFRLSLKAVNTPEGIRNRFPLGNVFRCLITNFTQNKVKPTNSDEIIKKTVTKNVLVFPTSELTSSKSTNLQYPSYNIITDKPFYINGETIVFEIETKNVNNNTEINYQLSGTISENDLEQPLSGSVIIVDNKASIEVKTKNDSEINNETLTLDLLGTRASKTVTIVGDLEPNNQILLPIYNIESDKKTVAEGEIVTFKISTLNIPNGHVINYTLSGKNITEDDFEFIENLEDELYTFSTSTESNLKGKAIVLNNNAIAKVKIASDNTLEASEVFSFSIDNTNLSTDVIILSDSIDAEEDTITPTIKVTTDKLNYNEGETIIYTIDTTNVEDGTVYSYSLFGKNITKSDISNNSFYGSFTIIENKAKVYIGIEKDLKIEDEEILSFSINNTDAFAEIIINAESSPSEPLPEDVQEPCLNAPVFGAPITDEKGSIISIPIIDKGCPYQNPPTIIIQGNGYGARGIPLLDNKGYVSEVRVTKTGTNYVKNLPDENLRCIIDSFTLINPGRGYTSAPKVIINGKKDLAEALVNSDGYVYGVRILDRSTEYYEFPQIIIQGGGGSGAKVLPNIVCRDPVELENIGYAKIGTGKYIDCP